jgi:uncharacterized membrane protein
LSRPEVGILITLELPGKDKTEHSLDFLERTVARPVVGPKHGSSLQLPQALANPLDVVQGLVLFVLIQFWLRLRSEGRPTASNLEQRPVVVALALLGFLWLNAVLLRTLHHWAGIPYELRAMLDSTLVQSALSVFWAFLALTTMLIATRIRARVVWLTGAVLLVAVVVKLFLVDLSSIGTIERIVSFVGVGLLMLVLGYFSPLPPTAEESQ